MYVDQAATAVTNKKQTWYNSYEFPFVPELIVKKANEHNSWGFQFNWLFLKIWTLDSFNFEFTIVASAHWGIGFIGIFPYLRWALCVPIPRPIERWFSKLTYRGIKY